MKNSGSSNAYFAKTVGANGEPLIKHQSRNIDLNDPALKDLQRKEKRDMFAKLAISEKTKQSEAKPRLDHNIFEGLDNRKLMDPATLKLATHKDIFGSCSNEVPSPT